MNEDRALAKKLKSFFHEEPSAFRESPIYSELSEISERYTNLEQIDSGGMKSIKRAFDLSTSRNVAFAELRNPQDEKLYEVFLREARLTALLEHPNIISIHDVGLNDEGQPYFTMDLKEGDSLSDIFKKLSSADESYLKSYSLHELLMIFVKICEAVAFAHSKNVIHLDLKPDNIQVGDFGEVLVCDWGLGKILNNTDKEGVYETLLDVDLLNHISSNNKVVGTPGFMSPEQIEKAREPDKRSDIYSLGGILFSILTYKRPLEGEIEYMLKCTVRGILKDPQDLVDYTLPNSLVAVVKRAMALKPEERYSSVLELRSDVQKYLSGYSTAAEDSNLYKEFKLFIKRNKAASLITLIALIFITCLSFFFIDALKEEISETKKASKRAEVAAEQFKNERNKANNLLDELTETFLQEAQLASETFVYQYPSESLKSTLSKSEKILETIPDHPIARERYILSLFIMQRFDKLLESPYKNSSPLLVELAKKYEPLINKKTNKLDILNLSQLFDDISGNVENDFSICERMLAYASEKSKYTASFGFAVKSLIKILNPEWDGEGYGYSNNRNKLELKSPQIKYLKGPDNKSSGQSVLRFMRIDRLNLRGSAIDDLSQLQSIKIESLDIRDTPIDQLENLYKLKKLSELIVYEEQFRGGQLANLPRSIRARVFDKEKE